MANDDMMSDFDPYDMLQEHNLLINRLINAHNKGDKLITEMAKQQEQLTHCLIETNKRLERLERQGLIK